MTTVKEKAPVIFGVYDRHADRRPSWPREEVNPYTGVVTMRQDPSKTKQSEMAACDINNIVREFTRTGMLSHISAKAATGAYADLPDSLDFQESLNTVIAAQASFDSLPSKVRSRFHNDAQEFLEFMADPANQDEAIKLGLAVDTRPPKPDVRPESGSPPPPPPPPPAAAAAAPDKPPSRSEGGV